MPWLSFADRSAREGTWNAQRLLNWYPRVGAGSAGQVLLRQHAGMTQWVTGFGEAIDQLLPTDKYLWVMEGGRFWRVETDGTKTALADVGNGDASTTMATDGLSVAVATRGLYMVHNIAAGTTNFPTITVLNSVTSVAFLNQRMIVSGQGTGRPDVMACSDLLDAETFGASAWATAERDPDKLRQVITAGSTLWALGARTLEPMYDSGAGDFPFVPYGGATVERGVKNTRAAAVDGDTLYFVGEDHNVYRASGFQIQRISTPGVTDALAAKPIARCFMMKDGNHTFFVVRLGGAPAWCYDVDMQAWSERSSGAGESGFKGRCAALFGVDGATNNEQVLGGNDGTLYRLDPDKFTDGGVVMRRWAVSQPVTRDGRFTVPRVEPKVTTGDTDLGYEPKMQLYTSRNGIEWGTPFERGMGLVGKREHSVRFNGVGSFEDMGYFALEVTDPVRCDVHGVNFRAR